MKVLYGDVLRETPMREGPLLCFRLETSGSTCVLSHEAHTLVFNDLKIFIKTLKSNNINIHLRPVHISQFVPLYVCVMIFILLCSVFARPL